MRHILKFFVVILLILPTIANAQVETIAVSENDNGLKASEDHLMALEQSPRRSLDEIVKEFEAKRFASTFIATSTARERRELLAQIRDAAAGSNGVGLERGEDGLIMMLEGADVYWVQVVVDPESSFKIANLVIIKQAPVAKFTPETLEAEIDKLMAEGRSGVVYVQLDGKPVLQKAYGMANSELEVPNSLETIFGIGSRPIDFTIASIYLLEQQRKLGLDDRLGKYFPDAPNDRAGMTIRQMMNGRSGLPDFPANDSDWDADLAWIDRSEFERRTMATPLLFAPGEGEAHSHWALGMLAAIVERASGQGYYPFLREHFFDPAGMEHTGNYGENRGLRVTAFAAGGGKRVGIPNIPPNWGPTSWLVMGSGGMYSTLGDLKKFYSFLTTGNVLQPRHAKYFLGTQVHLDGSERGFDLFSVSDENRSDEVYVFLNSGGGPGSIRPFVQPLKKLIEEN